MRPVQTNAWMAFWGKVGAGWALLLISGPCIPDVLYTCYVKKCLLEFILNEVHFLSTLAQLLGSILSGSAVSQIRLSL